MDAKAIFIQRGTSILQLKNKIKQLLKIKDTPHRLAFAFAAGVFIGMSPLLGLHTILGIALAWIFGLNRIVTLTGVFITNPWTIVPIYTFSTWIGAKMLGINEIIPDLDWSHITFTAFLNELKPLIAPFIVGTIFLGLIAAALCYMLIYTAVKKAQSVPIEKSFDGK
jgi:uncharacterized protein (DUF2062 family)